MIWESNKPSILPPSWVWTTVGTIYDLVGGGTPSTKVPEYWKGDVPWITSADIHGIRDIRPRNNISLDAVEESATNLVPAGSLIVVTRVGLGKMGITETAMCFSQDCQALVFQSGLMDHQYSLHYLSMAVQIFKYRNRGTTIGGVTTKRLRDLAFPLAPLPEQHRIVEKVETLFAELDKGIQRLQTAREQLRFYRHAVLKHAFEGKLTEKWRKDHALQLDTASALLDEVRAEREKRYLQQLDDWSKAAKAWQSHGGRGKKPTRPAKPKALPPLSDTELAELPELPEAWAWMRVGHVFDVFVGSTPSREVSDYWGGSINWVSSGEVHFCRIAETAERITRMALDNASTEVHPPGTVMLAMIGEGRTRGQAAILNTFAAHNQNTAAIRVSDTACPPEYVYYFFLYRYQNTRSVGSGNNQKALNRERVRKLVLPYPGDLEKSEIVQQIESRLSIVDQLEQTIDNSLQKAEVVRQSILKKAFEGRLVQQDPNDEPASVLLERIKAEKAKRKEKQRKTKE